MYVCMYCMHVYMYECLCISMDIVVILFFGLRCLLCFGFIVVVLFMIPVLMLSDIYGFKIIYGMHL